MATVERAGQRDREDQAQEVTTPGYDIMMGSRAKAD